MRSTHIFQPTTIMDNFENNAAFDDDDDDYDVTVDDDGGDL